MKAATWLVMMFGLLLNQIFDITQAESSLTWSDLYPPQD